MRNHFKRISRHSGYLSHCFAEFEKLNARSLFWISFEIDTVIDAHTLCGLAATFNTTQTHAQFVLLILCTGLVSSFALNFRVYFMLSLVAAAVHFNEILKYVGILQYMFASFDSRYTFCLSDRIAVEPFSMCVTVQVFNCCCVCVCVWTGVCVHTVDDGIFVWFLLQTFSSSWLNFYTHFESVFKFAFER